MWWVIFYSYVRPPWENSIRMLTFLTTNDILTITGGGGIEATAKVSEIASGILTDFEILDGGDAYTLEAELTVNNFGTRGSGFAGRITEIQDAYTFHFNNDYIFTI